MAEESIVQLIIQAKDLASQTIEKLKNNLDDLPKKTNSIQSAFKSLKEHWLGVSAAMVAGTVALNKAIDFTKLGAAAMQAEESFRQVTNAYGIHGDSFLAKMKEVSAGIIDDSDLMQRAVKGLQQGLSEAQIIKLLEGSRVAARTAGTDISTAFDSITNAVANQTTRALKLYGVIIDNEKAFEAYARAIGVSKDALTEQQKSAALAEATIAELGRQAQALGPLTMNASEKIQNMSAQLHELKENIGKGLINYVLPALGGLMYVIAGSAMTLASAVMKVAAGFLALGGNFKAAKEWWNDSKIMLEAANETAQKGLHMWSAIGTATAAAAGATEGFAKKQQEAANAVENAAARNKAAAEQNVIVKQAEVKAFEELMNYESALEKQKYQEGKATLQEYLDKVTSLREQYTKKMIELKEAELKALEADTKLTSSDRLAKEQAIELEILQIRLQSKGAQVKIESEKIEEVKKIQENGKKNFEALQEQQLESLKARLETRNTLEEILVSQGLMRQSEFLKNQLSRYRETAEEEIKIKAAQMQTLEQLDQTGSNEYINLATERIKLQAEVESNIIQSERKIAEQKVKEEEDAQNWIAQFADNRIKLAEMERDKNLEISRQYFEQSLIDAQQYADAKVKIENEFQQKSSEIQQTAAEENKIFVTTYYRDAAEFAREALRDMISFARAVLIDVSGPSVEMWKEKLKEAYKDVTDIINSALGTIKTAYEDLKNTGISSFAAAEDMMRKLADMAQYGIVNFHDFMVDKGKELAAAIGMTTQEWIGRIADYINYVKDLVASLQDYIQSLRMQLAQLKGDRMAELKMWYEQEVKKLEEKYKSELGMTKEYYEAMSLLQEIYNEKKKKLFEDEAQMKTAASGAGKQASGGPGGGGSTGSIAGGIITGLLPDLGTGFLAAAGGGIVEVKLTKDTKLDMNLTVPTLDPEGTVKWARAILFPEWEKYLKLKGVEL